MSTSAEWIEIGGSMEVKNIECRRYQQQIHIKKKINKTMNKKHG